MVAPGQPTKKKKMRCELTYPHLTLASFEHDHRACTTTCFSRPHPRPPSPVALSVVHPLASSLLFRPSFVLPPSHRSGSFAGHMRSRDIDGESIDQLEWTRRGVYSTIRLQLHHFVTLISRRNLARILRWRHDATIVMQSTSIVI